LDKFYYQIYGQGDSQDQRQKLEKLFAEISCQHPQLVITPANRIFSITRG
jgi:hypothetical protein